MENPPRENLQPSETLASMVNHAQVNGKANLVCDIVAPSADDSVALILWYKDDSLAPIYTVDARKGELPGQRRGPVSSLVLFCILSVSFAKFGPFFSEKGAKFSQICGLKVAPTP